MKDDKKMAIPIEQLSKTGPPPEPLDALHLVETEAPHEPLFFAIVKDPKFDFDRLIETASVAVSAEALCVEMLEELGLLESTKAVGEAKQQANTLLHKPTLDESDTTLLLHVSGRVDRHAGVLTAISRTFKFYETHYWENYSKRSGQKTDRIEADLYSDEMVPYEAASTLAKFNELRSKLNKGAVSRNATAVNNTVDAERVMRLLILDQISGGSFIASHIEAEENPEDSQE